MIAISSTASKNHQSGSTPACQSDLNAARYGDDNRHSAGPATSDSQSQSNHDPNERAHGSTIIHLEVGYVDNDSFRRRRSSRRDGHGRQRDHDVELGS